MTLQISPEALGDPARSRAVGLGQQHDELVSSGMGSTIDLAAPGGYTGTDLNGDGFGDGVLSTGASDADGTINPEFVFSNGTSMASPHVAGVAALVRGVATSASVDFLVFMTGFSPRASYRPASPAVSCRILR